MQTLPFKEGFSAISSASVESFFCTGGVPTSPLRFDVGIPTRISFGTGRVRRRHKSSLRPRERHRVRPQSGLRMETVQPPLSLNATNRFQISSTAFDRFVPNVPTSLGALEFETRKRCEPFPRTRLRRLDQDSTQRMFTYLCTWKETRHPFAMAASTQRRVASSSRLTG